MCCLQKRFCFTPFSLCAPCGTIALTEHEGEKKKWQKNSGWTRPSPCRGRFPRSEVKTLIRKGEVTVNGQVVKSADFGVDFDSDTIAVQGRELTLRQHLYLMLHKPKGVVSASEDRH